MVKRGEIWLINLDPTVGSKIQKTRPCVVVSPPEMHDYLRTIIIAPMTTGSRPAPFRIAINYAGKRGLILLDQMRAVDKTRLAKKLGAVTARTLTATLSALQEAFANYRRIEWRPQTVTHSMGCAVLHLSYLLA